jgi:RimJ/RimL family protein N-acetyltransferase
VRTQGELVRLRPVEVEDLEAVVTAMTHPGLLGVGLLDDDARPVPRSRQVLRSKVESWPAPEEGEAWIVDVDGLVGWARVEWGWDSLSPWMGVVIVPEHRRHGYGRDAARLLLRHCFTDTPAHTVHAWVVEWNEVGLRFTEAMGFTRAGRVRRAGILEGRYVDEIPFDLLRSEWQETRA